MTRELAIYQDIDASTGFGPEKLRTFLATSAGQDVTIRLNSQGGNVIDGLACYNLLHEYRGRKTVVVDGMALSIASLVAMAGDDILAAPNSWFMLHNPSNEVAGDAAAMRSMAGLMDGMTDQMAEVYASRTHKPIAEIKRLMDEETWLSGRDAVKAGFATGLTESLSVAATVDVSRFKNAPTAKHATSFEGAVQLAMASGLGRGQAVRAVAIERPGLHAAYIAAANGRPVPTTKPKAGVTTGQSATSKWNAAIAAKVKAGLPKSKAVRAVVSEDPELQAEYIAEANHR